MVASAFPLAVIGNVVRLLVIIIAASIWDQDAGNRVHDGNGIYVIFKFLPYVPAILALIYMERLLKEEELPVKGEER